MLKSPSCRIDTGEGMCGFPSPEGKTFLVSCVQTLDSCRRLRSGPTCGLFSRLRDFFTVIGAGDVVLVCDASFVRPGPRLSAVTLGVVPVDTHKPFSLDDVQESCSGP